MKELYKNKEGQVFFLYGGEQYEGYLEKARQTFPEIPVSNLFFAVNVARALEQVVQELLRQREQLDHPYHPFAFFVWQGKAKQVMTPPTLCLFLGRKR
ncbi:MAG: hypothetical protein RMH93_06845 [Aquificaceae bacterium]|nr:hypothetical protein [Aquificaceae bacterium]